MAGVKAPRLRAIRESKPLTQEELAKKAGVSRLTISKIEGGNAAFPSTIRKLAEALSVEPNQLVREG